MNQENEDRGYEILVEVARRVAPHLATDLIRAVYQIERQFLFDSDRDVPLSRIRQTVESAAQQISSVSSAGGNK
jgi:hypothetical protein